jgi:hypothetical protein
MSKRTPTRVYLDALTAILRDEGIANADRVAARLIATLGAELLPARQIRSFNRPRVELAYMTVRYLRDVMRHERNALVESLGKLIDAVESGTGTVDTEALAEARETLALARPDRRKAGRTAR